MEEYRERRASVLVQLLVTDTGTHNDLKKMEIYSHIKQVQRWEI